MTDRFKNALDAIQVMIDNDGETTYLDIDGIHENAIRDALKLATESEQLRKERDELQAKLDKAKDFIELVRMGKIWTPINELEERARTTLEGIE